MYSRIKKRLPRLMLELAVMMVFVFALEAYLTRDAVSGKAPSFQGMTIKGEPFALEGFRGKPAVVHFWATWCPVCNLEQGMIDGLAKGHPVITVAMTSGKADEVLAYLKEQGVDYPVLNDPQGAIAHLYGVKGVPASFIIDSQGEVRFVTQGYTSGIGMRMRLWWVSLSESVR